MTKLIIYILILLALGIGWIMNIAAIVHSDFGSVTPLLVLRFIGVFVVPLGTILGYFF